MLVKQKKTRDLKQPRKPMYCPISLNIDGFPSGKAAFKTNKQTRQITPCSLKASSLLAFGYYYIWGTTMLPALPLLWNVIFFLAQKNSACVVSEEYLDTAFSYLREVLVSVQRNHQSKMFTTNDFVNFLGRFLCYLICPAGYRMPRAPLELNWLQQCLQCLSPAPPPHSRSKFLCWAAPWIQWF